MNTLTAKAEDYLEHLYTHKLEGDPASLPEPDTQVEDELLRHGYLQQQDGELALTGEGQQQAEGAVRRHRLAERLLQDVIDVRGNRMDEVACEFEHSLHHGIDEQVCTLLGHPKSCPHGRPIPRGHCCRERKGATAAVITSLAEMKSGERGTVAYLSSRQPETVQKLMALGTLPGTPVTVIQTFPSVVFQVGHTQVAVDNALAGGIYVRRTRE